ncbi:hypothetical protein EDD18DRAFT_1162306 [Armillaria luteobubalina]|uniref:Uncharacterized protein n=1 Tax=Armillaria luteobubalina TaxID=153913 RepID=A0AA39UU49_9AGAR|nr:hypothetical protein EDD18DRAFT_1162306 [Armillaria luteobubalina]
MFLSGMQRIVCGLQTAAGALLVHKTESAVRQDKTDDAQRTTVDVAHHQTWQDFLNLCLNQSTLISQGPFLLLMQSTSF